MRTHTVRMPLLAAAMLILASCDNDWLVVEGEPGAPRNLEAYYYAEGVDLHWQTGPRWDGETFRVYGKRETDAEYFFIAEVTSCIHGDCVYRDVNVVPGVTYEYYVAAFDEATGLESASANAVAVYVPDPVPPPVPEAVFAVALDNSAYIHWDNDAAGETDFSVYRVYLADADGDQFLGETDSPGFIDMLAENGRTATYYVTSVDDQGHESDASELAACTPRPDYTGEVVYAHGDMPDQSGFRFQEEEHHEAVMSGNSRDRHFRIESAADGLLIAPGEGVRIHRESRWTSSLKCGPAADVDCLSWETAPLTGYTSARTPLTAGRTYMFRVPGDDGEVRFGAIRASITGYDQDDNELVVFDWAFQTQPGNPRMNTAGGTLGW